MFIGYGLVYPGQARDYVETVCDLLGNGVGGYAVDMLLETAAAETHTGLFRDPTPGGAGRGLFQCDRIAFEDVQVRAPRSDMDKVLVEFGIDVLSAEHRDLDFSPLLATIVCRLFYKRIPEAFPSSMTERANYWKRYYNTALGKGTPEQYIEKSQRYKV